MSISAEHSSHQYIAVDTPYPSLFDEPLLTQIHELLSLPADTAAWWTALAHRVDDLDNAFWEHRTAMEGPSGLFREVLDEQPRLTFQVRVLERDLGEISTEIAQLRLLVSASMGRPGGVPLAVTTATETVARIRGHHRRVHELLHEAYAVDLGASG